MKKTIFAVLTASVCFGSCCIVTAQTAQSDQITNDSEEIIQEKSSSTGTFEPVTVDANTSSDINLQFPLSTAGKAVAVSALDSGVVSAGNTPRIDSQGLLVFSFQVGSQPGVYRVIVIDPNSGQDSPHMIGMVRFEVPNPGE